MKILSQHRQQLRGSHDPKKHKSEEWLCFFDHTQSNRFLCSDQDEPVWIEGIVSEQNNTTRINYVESGYHHNEWQNKQAVGRIKATRKS